MTTEEVVELSETQRFLRFFVRDQNPDMLLVLSAHDHKTESREYKRFPAGEWEAAARWAEDKSSVGRSVYYKTCLFRPDSTRLIKENAQREALWLWADLDAMDPQTLPMQPTLLILSSPGRYQALWRLRYPVEIKVVESYCHALSTYGDRSGWDIGQELRVPGTRNFKYEDAPRVSVIAVNLEPYEVDKLALQPLAVGVWVDEPTTDIETLLSEGLKALNAAPTYAQESPAMGRGDGRGRSVALWQTLNRLKEDGYTAEQAFQAMWWSPLNKFRVDGRPPRDLWRDVVKCWKQEAPELITPAKMPEPEQRAEVEKRHIRWPDLVKRAIEAYRGPTLFVDETTALMFLSAYSVVFPNLKIEGHGVGLWTLLLGGQASGKSTLIGNMSHAVASIMPTLVLTTSGSPEGIMEAISTGPSLLAFEEYSEQLKLMAKKESYAVNNKELYQRLFDGAAIGHRTRRTSIQALEPYAVMMAATNVETWREFGDPDDIANGYLSRFVVLSEDLVRRSVNRSGLTQAMETITAMMGERMMFAQGVRNVALSNMIPVETGEGYEMRSAYPGIAISNGDLLLLEYQAELELKWDLKYDLDEQSLDTAMGIPPGRTLTKARKIAVMLELSEMDPQVVGETLFVRQSNVELAIHLSRLSIGWAQRAIGWLQTSQDKTFVDKIDNQLKKFYPEWVRPWDIAVRIRGLRAEGVKRMLQTMLESGMVEKRIQPRTSGAASELWRWMPKEAQQ